MIFFGKKIAERKNGVILRRVNGLLFEIERSEIERRNRLSHCLLRIYLTEIMAKENSPKGIDKIINLQASTSILNSPEGDFEEVKEIKEVKEPEESTGHNGEAVGAVETETSSVVKIAVQTPNDEAFKLTF